LADEVLDCTVRTVEFIQYCARFCCSPIFIYLYPYFVGFGNTELYSGWRCVSD